MRNKGRRYPINREGPAAKKRKLEKDLSVEMRSQKEKPARKIFGKREQDEKDQEISHPKKKRFKQMKLNEKLELELEEPRYSEFGHVENDRWEIYDWDRKMKEYEKELKDEEEKRVRRKEKAEKREKGWELMKICKKFIEENSTTWKDEEEVRKQRKDLEEKREERLREVARKNQLKENEIQKKISEVG